MTVAAGFFPEPGMRNKMKQVIHDSGFSGLIYQVWQYQRTPDEASMVALYPAFMAVRGHYKEIVGVGGVGNPPSWEVYRRQMDDEAAVAAFEEDLLFEVPESATPRIPPEDDKEPFTSFGKVKLKNPDQTGNPKNTSGCLASTIFSSTWGRAVIAKRESAKRRRKRERAKAKAEAKLRADEEGPQRWRDRRSGRRSVPGGRRSGGAAVSALHGRSHWPSFGGPLELTDRSRGRSGSPAD